MLKSKVKQDERAEVKQNRTTKAATKGFAIGSAALASFLLFSAFMDEVQAVVRARHAQPHRMAAPYAHRSSLCLSLYLPLKFLYCLSSRSGNAVRGKCLNVRAA